MFYLIRTISKRSLSIHYERYLLDFVSSELLNATFAFLTRLFHSFFFGPDFNCIIPICLGRELRKLFIQHFQSILRFFVVVVVSLSLSTSKRVN